jgi:asparagine synthase (glutamine-hydrolysing)
MRARGPDGEGLWHEDGVILGHRRLAVIDLDSRAAQPMHSVCGRYVITYNGEIYNYRELRRDLEGRGDVFHTTSDTEVILALFARYGKAMLPRLRGMFALVIWDRETRRAFAARDPYGIKPLYYAQTGQGTLLASQVKALLATGLVSREPDPRGQTGFWLLGSVPEPSTWYRQIKALSSGHCAWIQDGCIQEPLPWKDIGEAWRGAAANVLPGAEIQQRVHAALRESVANHLVADVTVGIFLSGGIDSGALAGLMVEAGARDLQGVTIAYDEFSGSDQDEAPVAARIAAHYGIRHHVRRVTREEFNADLPRILDAMDQPSIDGINTWYASKAVAECGLKVVVSGVGGDELFQGYSSFDRLPLLVSRWRKLSRLPGAMALAQAAASLRARQSGKSRWRYMPQWARTLPGTWFGGRSLFAPSDLADLMEPDIAIQGLKEFSPDRWINDMCGPLPSDARLALGQIESTTYLRNQLLRDSDWASMDHSVELRTPLVDAWLLAELQPLLLSFRQFPKKALLANSLEKPLPEEIIQRGKTGFGIPISKWLAASSTGMAVPGDSRDWARSVALAYKEGAGT